MSACSLVKAAVLAVLVLGGCGRPYPPNKITGSKIWGTVTYKKQPISSGNISFIPDNDPALSPTAIDIVQGKYELPVPAGKYKVHIVSRTAPAATKSDLAPGPGGLFNLTKDGVDTVIKESKELNFDF